MADMLTRLVDYPNRSVFDKDPRAVVALRVQNSAGLAWSIADRVLTIYTGAGLSAGRYRYPLAGKTIAQLADELAADGHDVVFESAELGSRGAHILLAGSGNQEASNGDRLMAYTSLLWALCDAFGVELDHADQQIDEALRQMVLTQAEGDWLDVWAVLYGVPRAVGETDADLQARLPEEVFRLRVNGYAIENAILDLTGFDVAINEPWKDIFRLDQSALSSKDKMYDGERVGYHLIQPYSDGEVDWSVVMPVIRRNKAAGVLVLDPVVKRLSFLDAATSVELRSGLHREQAQPLRYEDKAFLDQNLILDDPSGVIINHYCRVRKEIVRGSHVVVEQTYAADGSWHRDYRVHYLRLFYGPQSWTPTTTWAAADSSWSELTTVVNSGHTRIPA